jgi:hypothetical protein
MSTPIFVNTEAVRLVREAAQETHTVDGLEALRLVLDKMGGKPGLITDREPLASAYGYIDQKLAELMSTGPPQPITIPRRYSRHPIGCRTGTKRRLKRI